MMALLVLAGCSSGTAEIAEDFESITESSTLPAGWSLTSDGGVYQTARSGEAQKGSVALAIAGSGGRAELSGMSTRISPNTAVLASVWLRSKAFRDGTASLTLVRTMLGAVSEETLVAVRAISPSAGEWQKYEMAAGHTGAAEDALISLHVKLTGEGVLLIDNVQMRTYQTDPAHALRDGSFESPDPEGGYPDWKVISDGNNTQLASTQNSPVDGDRAIRLLGSGKWCVAISSLGLPSQKGQILVSGYCRANSGAGRLKIEYFLNDKQTGHTVSSPTDSAAWQLLSVISDPELSAAADRIELSLVAESPTAAEYSVDFDQLTLLVMML